MSEHEGEEHKYTSEDALRDMLHGLNPDKLPFFAKSFLEWFVSDDDWASGARTIISIIDFVAPSPLDNLAYVGQMAEIKQKGKSLSDFEYSNLIALNTGSLALGYVQWGGLIRPELYVAATISEMIIFIHTWLTLNPIIVE
jgi:hypothetical protein